MLHRGLLHERDRRRLVCLVVLAPLLAVCALPQLASAAGPPAATTKSAIGVTEKEATLRGTVNPEGAETKYLFEYGTTIKYASRTAAASVGSGTSPVEVSKVITGLTANTLYDFRILATNSNGTTAGANEVFTTTFWSAVEPPEPKSSKFSALEAVSCASSTACIGVSFFTNPANVDVPFAEKWNGIEWSAQKPPAVTGAEFNSLEGVSCTSSSACTAVGVFATSPGKPVPLAERWNGTEWSIQEPPAPTGAKSSHLLSVSCASSIKCTAAGYFANSSAKELPLAEVWNGTEWSIQEPPEPKEAEFNGLQGVSCTSSLLCTAVGYFGNSSGKTVPLAERWNGTAWSVQEPPAPKEAKSSQLRGVSCTSSILCTAVGHFANSSAKELPLAEMWNGAGWSIQETSAPKSAKSSALEGVSCTSSTECTAVGRFQNGLAVEVPLAERWNGAEWSIQEPPAPAVSKSNNLGGVSCTSSTECFAVGFFTKSSGNVLPLVERYK
jgi:hypothetical protein